MNTTSGIEMLYVFVDIKIDGQHFVETVKYNCDQEESLALVSTIQFVPTLQVGTRALSFLAQCCIAIISV